MHDIAGQVARHPRAALMAGPTPLHRLDRLSERLGLELWLKRDDLTGLGFGGNKIRQLEFHLGAAQAAGADTVLITGAVQSNFVRAAAAAAARCGMAAELQLEDRVPGMGPAYARSGNVLLGRLLGAAHLRYPHGEDEAGADAALAARAAALAREGRRAHVIPLGPGHPPLGALGYVLAAAEIAAQGPGFDAVVVASGSGQTHAGLLAGMRALGDRAPVHGICVRRPAGPQAARIGQALADLAPLLGAGPAPGPDEVLTFDGVLAPGYGRMGPAARAAFDLMARAEGIFLDPVYTAKTFAGLIALAGAGRIAPGARVLMVHTGGQPAIFGYLDDELAG